MNTVLPAFERAFRLAIPEPPKPSKRRFALQLLPLANSWESISHWRKGRRRPPQWARDRLADYLERDAHEKLAVAKLLRSENEKAPD